jgi:hypothetical protein
MHMLRSVVGLCLLLCVALLMAEPAGAEATVGLIKNVPPQEGFILFSPMPSETTFLINNDGLLINSWTSAYEPGFMAYLLENGDLLRAAQLNSIHSNFQGRAGTSGRIEEYDWDGSLVWKFDYSSDSHLTHHDFEPLPNGNILMIAWERITAATAIQAGKNPALVGSALLIDCVIEVEPAFPVGGSIVWEWCAWDHLIQDFDPSKDNFGVVADHPELIDFNFGNANIDWTHFNGIDYNADFDQIVLSAHGLDEIWIIDHSTTTAEAAGHTGGIYRKGGDLLYRWGNPQTYRRGNPADQQLHGQHDAQWIAEGRLGAGNILIYDNGNGRPQGQYSAVDEIVPPADEDGGYPALLPGVPFGPVQPLWSYVADPPTSFFSNNISGAERLPSGNTLVCEGSPGRLFEVESTGSDEIVWDYINPVSNAGIAHQGDSARNGPVFKARWYPADFPGFAGQSLAPGDPIEQFTRPYPVPEDSVMVAKGSPDGDSLDIEWDAFSCPSSDYILLFGALEDVSNYLLTGAECGIGVSGGYFWSAVPASDLFFLVVGTDDLGVYESSWGRGFMGEERSSTKSSLLCGGTTKIVTSTCP